MPIDSAPAASTLTTTPDSDSCTSTLTPENAQKWQVLENSLMTADSKISSFPGHLPKIAGGEPGNEATLNKQFFHGNLIFQLTVFTKQYRRAGCPHTVDWLQFAYLLGPTWVQFFTVGIAEGLTSRLKYLTLTPLPTH